MLQGSLYITDLSGRAIRTARIDGHTAVSLKDLARGIYCATFCIHGQADNNLIFCR